jgi:hypothetical protein
MYNPFKAIQESSTKPCGVEGPLCSALKDEDPDECRGSASAGDIYMYMAPTQVPMVKIGYSSNALNRVQQWLETYPPEMSEGKLFCITKRRDARGTEGLLHRMFVPERILPETLEDLVGVQNPDGKTEWFVISERMNSMFKEQMQVDLIGMHKRLLSEKPRRTLGSQEEVSLGDLMRVYFWVPRQGFKLLRWGFRKSPKVTLAALAIVLIQAFGALNPVVKPNTPVDPPANPNISRAR